LGGVCKFIIFGTKIFFRKSWKNFTNKDGRKHAVGLNKINLEISYLKNEGLIKLKRSHDIENKEPKR
jgi:hypothetical protein